MNGYTEWFSFADYQIRKLSLKGTMLFLKFAEQEISKTPLISLNGDVFEHPSEENSLPEPNTNLASVSFLAEIDIDVFLWDLFWNVSKISGELMEEEKFVSGIRFLCGNN